MKRIISLILACLLALSFAACSNGGGNEATPAPQDANAGGDENASAAPKPTEPPTADPTKPPEGDPQAVPQCTLAQYPKVDGSTANIPMAMALVQLVTGCTEEEAENTINFSTTDFSYDALNKRDCSMLLVYEASKPTKERLDPENTFDMRPIGLDALVFITNVNNPVESLTEEQLRGIFSGRIKNWSEVGGLDQPIVAFQRPVLSGSQTLMLDLVMKDVPMAPEDEILVSSTMSDVIVDIAAYDNSANAIGYSVYYYAQNMYNQPNLKFIRIDGVEPNFASINAGEYPYINPFYAILPKTGVDQMAKKLVDWLETEAGQYFVAACGYVPYMRGLDLEGK